jgi:pyridoxine kinase
VIPILSAMGIQVCSLPTAILSTHTGGFADFHFRDLTSDMRSIIAHWRRLSLSFAGIYSGFLGSSEQIDIVDDFIRAFRTDSTLVVVDPVLGMTANSTIPWTTAWSTACAAWWLPPT